LLDPRRIDAILFDLDGTLADTDDTYVRRFAAVLRPFLSIIRNQNEMAYARRIIMATESPLNFMLGVLDRFSLDEWIRPLSNGMHRLRGEAKIDDARLIPGSDEALTRLAVRYPLALVTAREKHSADALLRTLQIQSHFQSVATAGTCRRSKPHPAPVLWTCEQLGLSPQYCLMVGDTPVDIHAGRAAGTQTVGVLCGFGEREELLRSGADLVLNSTADLPAVLLEKGNHVQA
jgi:phosphoglycolate phosphatase-like HAD superfamily hydrolase